MAADDPTANLPPRPDAATGEPVPPSAPTQTAEGYNEKTPSWRPAPPEGHGPALAHYLEKRYLSWLGGFIPVVVLLIAFVAYDGWSALTIWPLWLLLAAAYAWTVYVNRSSRVAAGSDWVMIRKYWVDTYELTQIHLRSRGANEPGLFLADGERTVDISIGVIQANPRLWDYVYLGMRHSAAKGAEVNLAARGTWPELANASRHTGTGNE